MILYRECPICNSSDLKGYAIDCHRPGPHISRVECQKCKLVFANPMADASELSAYYSNYYEKPQYEKTHYKNLILDHFHRIKSLSPQEIFKEAAYMAHYPDNERFLDVGCGLGLGLAYANRLGFDLYATEFDSGALEFVQEQFKVEVFQGELFDANYPDNHFSFVYISHVIEHVLDPIQYIREIHRILKPGGTMAIGTPNMSSNLYKWYRVIKLLSLQVPLIIDGVEHTFIFPKKLLAKICKNEDFEVVHHFTHGMGEKLQNLLTYKISFNKRMAKLIQNYFQVNQWIICKKPGK